MEDDIDLRRYVASLWRWRLQIGTATVAGAVIAGLLSFMIRPMYEAHVVVAVTSPAFRLGVRPDPTAPETGLLLMIPEVSTQAVAVLASSPMVLRDVAQQLEGRGVLAEVKMLATADPAASLVRLRVRSSDPIRSADAANAWGKILVQRGQALFYRTAAANRPLLTIISEATPQGAPVMPRKVLNIVLGTVLGLFLSIVAVSVLAPGQEDSARRTDRMM